jgi:hypothetical protein
MAGYRLLKQIQDLEKRLDSLGMMMCHPKHYYDTNNVDMVGVQPIGDFLPIYSRDASLFFGTIDELEQWLKGFELAREYDRLLFGKTHAAKRERKEQDYRNEILVQILKNSEST